MRESERDTDEERQRDGKKEFGLCSYMKRTLDRQREDLYLFIEPTTLVYPLSYHPLLSIYLSTLFLSISYIPIYLLDFYLAILSYVATLFLSIYVLLIYSPYPIYTFYPYLSPSTSSSLIYQPTYFYMNCYICS
jgi:hypothetical protein